MRYPESAHKMEMSVYLHCRENWADLMMKTVV